jgi:hypothetical protein
LKHNKAPSVYFLNEQLFFFRYPPLAESHYLPAQAGEWGTSELIYDNIKSPFKIFVNTTLPNPGRIRQQKTPKKWGF